MTNTIKRVEELYAEIAQGKQKHSDSWSKLVATLPEMAAKPETQPESPANSALRDLLTNHFLAKSLSERAAYPVAAVDTNSHPVPGLPSGGKSPRIG